MAGKKNAAEQAAGTEYTLVPCYKVRLARERSLKVPEVNVRGPDSVAGLLQQYLKNADREHFVVLMLNAQHEVVGIHTATIGTIDSSLIHPREVFKPAILANAAAIIVAHNHPSGNPTPSMEDRHVTRQLCDAGDLLGIPIIDHVIVGTAPPFAFYSFAQAGTMPVGGE